MLRPISINLRIEMTPIHQSNDNERYGVIADDVAWALLSFVRNLDNAYRGVNFKPRVTVTEHGRRKPRFVATDLGRLYA